MAQRFVKQRQALVLCLLIVGWLTGAALAGDARPFKLTPAKLEPRAGKTAQVEPATSDEPEALVFNEPIKLEMYGLDSRLIEGTWRVIFRLRTDRPARSDEALSISMWGARGSLPTFRFTTRLAPSEFGPGDGKPVEIARQFRAGPSNGNLGLSLNGGWEGLRLESVRFEPVEAPLTIQRLRADKLVYPVGQAGQVNVTLRNGAPTAQRVRLTVEIESGLSDAVKISDAAIDVPPRTDGKDFTITIPLPPQRENGHQLRAVVRRDNGDSAVLDESRDWFYVSDHPVRIGHLAAWGSEKNYEPNQDVDQFVEDLRRRLFPLAEMTFWAPDDFAMLVPPPGKDRWWSGQTLAQLSTATINARIKAAHAQGMKVLAYTDLRLDFGFRVAEVFRRHPEWCNWDANDTTMGWSPAEIARQMREDDAERWDPKEPNKPRFGARGVWGPQTGNPAVVDFHIGQLLASIKQFDWDGFRFDDPYDYDFTGVDLLGRQMPFQGLTSPVLLARLRGAIERAKPGIIYGHNMEWTHGLRGSFWEPMPLDVSPTSDDYYTEHLRDDGLHLQERVTVDWKGGTPWERIAEQAHRLGHNAARYGGHAYAINPAHSLGVDGRTLTALMLASRVHLAYWASEAQIPYLRLAARHCDLLYGQTLQPAPGNTLSVEAPTNREGAREPWWQRYVRVLEPAPGQRIYLVHLINPPVKPKVDDKNQLPPPTIEGLKLRWNLPAQWKAQRAWQITADEAEGLETVVTPGEFAESTTVTPGTMPTRRALPVRVDGGATIVTPQGVVQWSIIAVECTGPATDRLPEWRHVLPPVPAQPANFTADPAPANYTPNGEQPVVFAADHALWKSQTDRVDDRTCAASRAVRVRGTLSGEAYLTGVQGGRYRLSLRVNSPQLPPPDASINATCWAKDRAWTMQKNFTLDSLKPGQWTDLAIESDLSWDHGNFGLKISGGWDGLLIDRLEIRQIKSLTEAQRLADQGLRDWPVNLAPDPNGGAYVMLGLYHEALNLPTVLKDMGLPVSTGDWYVFRASRGINGAQLAKPEELAKYRLIALVNIDRRTFTVQQRAWLKGWVEAGGSLLVTGGPYALGRGWWHESDYFAPMLPAMLKPFDLRPSSEPLSLRGAGPLANLSLPRDVATTWLHEVTPRSDAQVALTAGDKPALVLGRFGKGRVALLTITPLGEDFPKAWWLQKDTGAKIADAACRWLLEGDASH